MPFTYEPGVTADALEYVGIYVFLLVMIGTFLLVPVFASDRQTRADQILKCFVAVVKVNRYTWIRELAR